MGSKVNSKVTKVKKKLIKMKVFIAFLLQLPLIVLANDVALSDSNNRDNTTHLDVTTTASVRKFAENTTLSLLNESSTISGVDKNSTENVNGILKNETITTTTTEEPTTTTPDPSLQLIPPATVEAQIVKANISTKKPSRLQAAA